MRRANCDCQDWLGDRPNPTLRRNTGRRLVGVAIGIDLGKGFVDLDERGRVHLPPGYIANSWINIKNTSELPL
ncbi:hypothetical protein SAMN02745121_06256 [Nannocystis exedens]|uniref:Uncharacterized protein n=1 Tax=Nannocystis exedens TaxID=54 RepID=A0A1I2ESZ4_9BACT|nr:hypothetical protein NAEX_06913 [Nannocystis exedens]SFE95747.1 hypothetical protein SAMN02745121_06256 [Nannocystis exedens]